MVRVPIDKNRLINAYGSMLVELEKAANEVYEEEGINDTLLPQPQTQEFMAQLFEMVAPSLEFVDPFDIDNNANYNTTNITNKTDISHAFGAENTKVLLEAVRDAKEMFTEPANTQLEQELAINLDKQEQQEVQLGKLRYQTPAEICNMYRAPRDQLLAAIDEAFARGTEEDPAEETTPRDLGLAVTHYESSLINLQKSQNLFASSDLKKMTATARRMLELADGR